MCFPSGRSVVTLPSWKNTANTVRAGKKWLFDAGASQINPADAIWFALDS